MASALTYNLRKSTCEVAVASPFSSPNPNDVSNSYDLRQFPLHDPFYGYGLALLNRYELQYAIAQERPDLVLVHGPMISLGCLIRLDKPIVSIVHGTYHNEVRWMKYHPISGMHRVRYLASIGLTDQFDMRMYQHSSRLPNAFLVGVCDSTRNELASVGVRDSQLKSILNGVNKSQFRPLDRQGSRSLVSRRFNLTLRNHLVFSLGPSPRKGTHILIRAASLVRREFSDDFALIIGGGGQRSYMEHLRSLARAYGLEDNIQFVGFIPTKDLPLFYNSADVMVAPSYSEGAALSVPESLACGTPVVATRVGGNEQYLRRAGTEDLLVDVNQYDFSPWLAERIVHALEQKREVKIEAIPSWEDVAAEYLSYFHSIMGR